MDPQYKHLDFGLLNTQIVNEVIKNHVKVCHAELVEVSHFQYVTQARPSYPKNQTIYQALNPQL